MICLYPANTVDFTKNGIMILDGYATRCNVDGKVGQLMTLDMELRADSAMAKITEGMYVRCPSPIRETPQMDIPGETTPGTIIWEAVKPSGYDGRHVFFYSKPVWDYQYKVDYINFGQEYIYIEPYNDKFHRAVSPKGKAGYVLNQFGQYKRTEGGTSTAGSVISARQTRDQIYRIQRVEHALESVVVTGTQIAVELKNNYIASLELTNVAPQAAINAVLSGAAMQHPFSGYAQGDTAITASIGRTSPYSALWDEDKGLAGLTGMEMLADDFDVFLLEKTGKNRGGVIRAGKNVTGMRVITDNTEVCTRVIPVAYDASGNDLYLDGTPWVDSPRAAAFPAPVNTKELDLRDIRVGSSDYATVEAARAEMLRRANAFFDGVVDRPGITIEIDYVDLSKSDPETAQRVSYFYLGDMCRAQLPGYDMDFTARVTTVSYDVLRDMYTSLVLGTPTPSMQSIRWEAKNIASGTLDARTLGARQISAILLGNQAVESNNIQTGAITSTLISAAAIQAQHIDTGAVTADAIAANSISAAKLAAGSVTASKIGAGEITADKIAAGTLTSESGVFGEISGDLITSGKVDTDRLIIGGTEFSIVRALNQLANTIIAGDDRIAGNILADHTISAVKVTDDFGAGLELSSNAAILLLAGKLDGSHSHMELTDSAINMVGGDINIATDDLQVRGMADGVEIMSLTPDGLSAKNVVVTGEFSAPNVVTKLLSSTVPWRGGIQASINACPKWISGTATLQIPAGVYVENLWIAGFKGGELILDFSDVVTLLGHVSIVDCDRVTLKSSTWGNGKIYPLTIDDTITATNCGFLLLRNMALSGYRGRTSSSDGTAHCVATYEGFTHLLNCTIEYARDGAYFTNGARGYVQECTGGNSGTTPTSNANLRAGVTASAATTVAVQDTIPQPGTFAWLGTILGSATATSGGMTYSAPTTTTKTYTCTSHCNYVTNTSESSSGVLAYQGRGSKYQASDTGWTVGAIWFDGTSELSGKTITAATLTFVRGASGFSQAAKIRVGAWPYAYGNHRNVDLPYNQVVDPVEVASLQKGGSATVDVTRWMNYLKAGQGLCFYEPRGLYNTQQNYSDNYASIYADGSDYVPVLSVAYQA